MNKNFVIMALIDKDLLKEELNTRIEVLSIHEFSNNPLMVGEKGAYLSILSFLDTLEVKEVDIWHLQEKEDIYDAVKDWSLHTFACVMKDGTIQKFTGNLDEDYEGHIGVHIDGVNDDYDNVDDIVKWIKFT